MGKMSIIVLILTIAIASTIVATVIKKKIYTDLYLAINEKEYDYFFAKVDKVLAKAMLDTYTREGMRLSVYIAQTNKEEVKNQFNKMMKMKLNNYQLSDLLTKGYRYYYQQGDIQKSGKIFEQLKTVMSGEQISQYEDFLVKSIKNYKRQYEV